MPTRPKFVLYSTRESRVAGVVSILALTEAIVFVAIYWLLWLKLGVTWHHWLIVCATPMVLLRSDASISQGAEWFDGYLNNRRVRNVWIVLTVLIVAACLQSLLLSVVFFGRWQDHWSDFGPFPRTVVLAAFSIGLSATIVFASFIALLGTSTIDRLTGGFENVLKSNWLVRNVLGPFFLLGTCLGILVRAAAIRIVATFFHPLDGLKALPGNWRRLVWSSDLFDPPALVPGHSRFDFDDVAKVFLRGRDRSRKDLAAFVILAFVLFLPTIVWKWSIKSTAWFYLPFVWVGRGWQNLNDEQLLIWARGYSQKWSNIVGMLFATLLLALSVAALFVPEEYFDLRGVLEKAGAPMSAIGLVFVLDWQSLIKQPWQWFYVPSWILTLTLFFLIDDQSIDIEKGANLEERYPSLKRWMWVGNIRAALTNLGLGVALIYFLAAVDAWGQILALLRL